MRSGLRKKALEARNTGRLLKGLLVFVALCVCFFLGFMLRGNEGLMDRMGISSLSAENFINPGMTVSGDTYDSLAARVAEVQGILQDESNDSYDLNTATTEVLDAFADSTHDPYVHYYDAQSYASYQQRQRSSYYGIGVLFGSDQDRAYAVDVFEGSTAQANGVHVGDKVMAIDGVRDEAGWRLADTLEAIASHPDESIVITWLRQSDDSAGEEYTTTLLVSPSEQINVTSQLYGDVGYIDVRQLGSNAADLTAAAITQLTDQGALGFVLDLRDVPGGYLTQAVDIVSLFHQTGTVVQIQSATAVTTRATEGEPITNLPLCILVNGNTAAAAEVLTAALQDDSRAIVVGSTTLGRGSIQVVRELSFGGAISFTAAYYKTPRGRMIDGTGVNPDIVIDDDNPETQKQFAIDVVASEIKG